MRNQTNQMDVSTYCGYILWMHPWIYPQSPWMHPYCVDISMDASTVDGYIHGCIHSGRLYPWMHPESMDASILRGYIHGCIHRVWIYPWMHPQSPWMHPYCVDISMDAST